MNVIAGFIGLYSLYMAAKPRDEDHPYGHGKAEFISAAVEGTLIIIAGLVIIYESIDNFINPRPLQRLDYWHDTRCHHSHHQLLSRNYSRPKRKEK